MIYKGQQMVIEGSTEHRADVLEAIVRELSANELTKACERDGDKDAAIRWHNSKIVYLLVLHPDDLEFAIGRDVIESIRSGIYPIALVSK